MFYSPKTSPTVFTFSAYNPLFRARATLPNQFVVMNTNDNGVDIVAASDIISKYHLGIFEANRTTNQIGDTTDFILPVGYPFYARLYLLFVHLILFECAAWNVTL